MHTTQFPATHMKRVAITLVILFIAVLFGAFRSNVSAAPMCSVDYDINDQWSNGFRADVVITNNTSTAIDGWTLAWTFSGDQNITSLWNGSLNQSGADVTVDDATWNANIPPQGSVSFGFQSTYSGTNEAPTIFELNGTLCNEDGGNPTPTAVVATDTATPASDTPTTAPATNTPTAAQPTNTGTPVPPTGTPTEEPGDGTPTSTPNVPCEVLYDIENQWFNSYPGTDGGFKTNVMIRNNGPNLDAWELTFTFPDENQEIGNIWPVTAEQTGADVVVSSPEWDGALPNGAVTEFSFIGAFVLENPRPREFQLNGETCGKFVFVYPTQTVTPTRPPQEPTAPPPPDNPDTNDFVGYLDSQYVVPPSASQGNGIVSLTLANDAKSATLSLTYADLTDTASAISIRGPAKSGANGSALLILPSEPFEDFVWTFADTSSMTSAEIVNALKNGRLYISVQTDEHPDGEIRGQLHPILTGAPANDTPTEADAIRFLNQATFGATQADVDHLINVGYTQWFEEQFTLPAADISHYDVGTTNAVESYEIKRRFFQNALNGDDQLRQRMAWALSQIFVVSTKDINQNEWKGTAIRGWIDTLHRGADFDERLADGSLDTYTGGALGNYRTIMEEITLNPGMGDFLDMAGNCKPDPATGSQPNENYARELLQLFVTGVFKLNLDGTIQVSAEDRPIETYGNSEVIGYARALTAWDYDTNDPNDPTKFNKPLKLRADAADCHDTSEKQLLDGVIGPAGLTAEEDLDLALDDAFNHPNVGPFVSRQLIQHFVTSDPSPEYVARVASIFNDNGSGVRGDLQAVVKAILLDPEARGNQQYGTTYGKVQEPTIYIARMLRSLDATGQLYGIPIESADMGQDVFAAPSVFNYYSPEYRVIYGDVDFNHPPAELMSTKTIIDRLNFVNDLIYGDIRPTFVDDEGQSGQKGTSVQIDLSTWESLATDPEALVDELDRFFMHGTMRDDVRALIIEALEAETSADGKVKAAVYLVLTSPQYQVQR